MGPRNARSEAERFPKHKTAAQHKVVEVEVWLTHRQPGRAAVAEDDIKAFVGLKACVSSEGRLFAHDVVAVFARRQGLSLNFGYFWIRGHCCFSCDFLKVLNCKRTKKK